MKRNLFLVFLILLCSDNLQAQIISTIAGNGTLGYSGDGAAATVAELKYPYGVALDTQGYLYIGGGSVIRKVNSAGIISTFAGTGVLGYNGDNILATLAQLTTLRSIAIDKKNNVFFFDGSRIRKVNTSGIITTVAGNGGPLATGDGGPATAATIGNGLGLCLDDTGNIYIFAQNRIRKVDTFGIIRTFGGVGIGGYSGDGSRVDTAKVALNSTGVITFDNHHNLYLIDGNVVRRISPLGIITTFAGIQDTLGFNGDGGPATAARFTHLFGMCIDKCDNVFVADRENERIRVVTTAGIVTTIAGTGASGYSGDGGPATAATFMEPENLCIDKNSNLYIADNYAFVVRYIAIDPHAGTIIGTDSVCPGKTITLSGTIGGGTWVSSNTGVAIAGISSGIITGVAGGADTILYIISMGCISDTAKFPITVKTATQCVNAVSPQPATGRSLQVFPNPNDGSFSVSLLSPNNEVVSVTITDIIGKVVHTFTALPNEQTSVQLPLPGLYFITAGGQVAKVVVY